jgi:hypothetical protein
VEINPQVMPGVSPVARVQRLRGEVCAPRVQRVAKFVQYAFGGDPIPRGDEQVHVGCRPDLLRVVEERFEASPLE